MRHTAEYCFARAAECEARASYVSDEAVRTFLIQMRDSWIAIANRVGMLADGLEPPPLTKMPDLTEIRPTKKSERAVDC
jgi:hypothetical protein